MLAKLKNLNLALAFLSELIALVAFCYFGFTLEVSLALRIILGIGLPVVAIVIWALYGAPRSKRRLQGLPFLFLQIVFFGCAAVALYSAGQHLWGIIFALAFVLNTALAYVWGQK